MWNSLKISEFNPDIPESHEELKIIRPKLWIEQYSKLTKLDNITFRLKGGQPGWGAGSVNYIWNELT